ncbi:hypothetical protein OE810_13115 [Rhodobacteraceae bacterium XHP0102]|nr:hypothetical protein [Rhodobacteraceae bacterium XHP0102]
MTSQRDLATALDGRCVAALQLPTISRGAVDLVCIEFGHELRPE